MKGLSEVYTELRVPENAFVDYVETHGTGFTEANYTYVHSTTKDGKFCRVRLMNMEKLSKKD
jgi:hypothetical protein